MRFTRAPRRVDGEAVSRRDALRMLGGAAGAAAFAPWMASCGDGASPAGATSSLRPEDLDIETVIVVMMENRSFDHYFGALQLQENRAVDGLSSGIALPPARRESGRAVSHGGALHRRPAARIPE